MLDDYRPQSNGKSDWELGKQRGRLEMLELMLTESRTFEAMMRKRRFFNNANGVKRFREYLKTVIPEAKDWPL